MKLHFVLTLSILGFLVTECHGVEIKLSENYLLEYHMVDCQYYCDSECIYFYITAINVTGWVGLGFNAKRADMDGSDLLIGGWARSGGEYMGDYHVPENAGNVAPTRDRSQDLRQYSYASERDGRTTFSIQRRLNTGDEQEDIKINNETLFLIWAYNANSDDVTEKHTHMGSLQINLLEDFPEGCQYTTEVYTEPPTDAPTTEPPWTDAPGSTPAPNGCPPTGTDLIPHPSSCSLYFICVEGTAYQQECGGGLHFNPVIKECDYPENVNCTLPLPECPPDGVSLHPYPGNCSMYIICAEGTPIVRECAPDTCFDPEELKCLPPGSMVSVNPSWVFVKTGSKSYRPATSKGNRHMPWRRTHGNNMVPKWFVVSPRRVA